MRLQPSRKLDGDDALFVFCEQDFPRRVRRFNRGKNGVKAQRRGHRGNGGALQEMSSGDRQMQNSCWLEKALLRTQYKARVRQITLLFPHDIRASAYQSLDSSSLF